MKEQSRSSIQAIPCSCPLTLPQFFGRSTSLEYSLIKKTGTLQGFAIRTYTSYVQRTLAKQTQLFPLYNVNQKCIFQRAFQNVPCPVYGFLHPLVSSRTYGVLFSLYFLFRERHTHIQFQLFRKEELITDIVLLLWPSTRRHIKSFLLLVLLPKPKCSGGSGEGHTHPSL